MRVFTIFVFSPYDYMYFTRRANLMKLNPLLFPKIMVEAEKKKANAIEVVHSKLLQ